jgi:hypothetical protein
MLEYCTFALRRSASPRRRVYLVQFQPHKFAFIRVHSRGQSQFFNFELPDSD